MIRLRPWLWVGVAMVLVAGCRNGREPYVITARLGDGVEQSLERAILPEFAGDALDRLRQPGAPQEVILLDHEGAWSGPIGTLQILIWEEGASIRYDVAGQDEYWYERTLDRQEVRELRRVLRENRADELPAFVPPVHDGHWFYFFRATSRGATVVYINNPDFGHIDPETGQEKPPQTPHWRVVSYLEGLTAPERLTLKYRRGRAPKNAELVCGNPHILLEEVWAEGQDIRVRPRNISVWQAVRDGRLGDETADPVIERHHEQSKQLAPPPSMAWCASPDPFENETIFGQINLRSGQLHQVRIENMKFDSYGMWVDHSTGLVYAIHQGLVYRFPLPAPPKGYDWTAGPTTQPVTRDTAGARKGS